MNVIQSLGLQSVGVVLAIVIGVAVVFAAISRAARMYHKVPPSRVMVVYGRGKTTKKSDGKGTSGVRLITGGGAFIIPLIEEYQMLDLTVMTVEEPRDRVYTVDGIPLDLDWNAIVAIGTDEVSMLTAATAFLGMDKNGIVAIISKTLSTNNRAIVGQMTVEDLHRDRDAFVQRVQKLAADEMASMGLIIKQMGVRDIKDEDGYFAAMAAPKVAAIKRDAAIAEAEATRDAQVKSAAAKLAGEQADVGAQTQIIEAREALALRDVAQKRTVALSQADADQEVEAKKALVVAQEQERTVLAPARARKQAAQIEAEALQTRTTIEAEAARKVKQIGAEAEATATTTAAEAEAQARLKKASAEAQAVELAGAAEASRVKALATAEAEGTRAKLTAEADGTEARLLAEAKGKREIADAAAAQDEINLRQAIAELMLRADVEKAKALAEVLAGIGGNVRIVQMGSDGQSVDNSFLGLLNGLPELFTRLNIKTEALTDGQSIESILERVLAVMRNAPPQNGAAHDGKVEAASE